MARHGLAKALAAAAGRSHWGEAEARPVVRAWESSGQSLRAFAATHGLNAGEVETEARVLPTGRKIDVFRIFTTESSAGLVLHYFYITRQFRDPQGFEAEWAEVVRDAQQEADRQKATILMLVGSERDAWLIARFFREVERTKFFRRTTAGWTEDVAK